MKKRQAFSLIELAAVLAIIALLSIGIMQGTSIVYSSRLSSARSITSKSAVPEIEGLVAWYETSLPDSFIPVESVKDSQISEWRDISPSSIAAQRNKLTRTASSSIIYKTDGINNLPSVHFKGSGNFTLSGFYQGTLPQSTIFIVFTPYTITSQIMLDSTSSPQTAISMASQNQVLLDAGSCDTSCSYTLTANNPASFTNANDYILAAYFNNTSSQAFLNDTNSRLGLDTSDSSPDGLLAAGSNAMHGIKVGGKYNGSLYFTGLISEIIIYNRPLQQQERREVMKYLSAKYKIFVTGL